MTLSKAFISSIKISQYGIFGQPFSFDEECQYADGNGYLFIFHKDCDPFYVTYDPIALAFTTAPITIQIRDLAGASEPGIDVTR